MSTSDTVLPTPSIVVTGASRGVGAAIAARLAADGYSVFACSRRPVESLPEGVNGLHLDVTDPASVRAAVDVVAERVGGHGLFGLVNNAGVLEAAPLEFADAAMVDRHLRTNVVGPLSTVQAFLPLLRAGRGRVVNVSSINARLPIPYWGLYSASKAALDALTDALRMELAPDGIRVSLLTLGAFATDIRRRGLQAWPAADGSHESHATAAALVAMLDATAGDPSIAAGAVASLLEAADPAPHAAVGDGIEDLLALAAQPAAVRDATLGALLEAARAAA